jgi:hypothetical protein
LGTSTINGFVGALGTTSRFGNGGIDAKTALIPQNQSDRSFCDAREDKLPSVKSFFEIFPRQPVSNA